MTNFEKLLMELRRRATGDDNRSSQIIMLRVGTRTVGIREGEGRKYPDRKYLGSSMPLDDPEQALNALNEAAGQALDALDPLETRIFIEQGTGKTFECKELPKD